MVRIVIAVAYQQQTFITTDQSAFQRAGTTGQYTITGQPSPLTPVAPQTAASTPQRPLNGQFMDPASTPTQPVGYERQDYVNGYQQQVRIASKTYSWQCFMQRPSFYIIFEDEA